MNFIKDGTWQVNTGRFTALWGATPSPPDLKNVIPGVRQDRRSMSDVLYKTPELIPFRSTDHTPLPSLEVTDHTPQERPFVRRLLGAAAAPLDVMVRQMDTLPLNLRVESSTPEWLAYLLMCAGFPLVTGVPQWVLRRVCRNLDVIMPLGTTESAVRFIESVYGTGSRENTTTTDALTKKITLTTTLTTPDGDQFVITEVLPAQDLSSITSERMLKFTVPTSTPEWLTRQISRLYPAHFTPNLELA